jgi:hypothetical protein
VNKIVPDTQLREHGRRLAVLEEALAVFSKAKCLEMGNQGLPMVALAHA